MFNYRQAKILYLILVFISFFIDACAQQGKTPAKKDSLATDWNQTIPGNFSAQSKEYFDSTQVKVFFEKYPDLNSYEDLVQEFYSKRKFTFAWFEDGRLIEQADNLSNRTMDLKNDGVYKILPYQAVLDSLLYGINISTGKIRPDVILELMLTSQYFAFSRLAWQGMGTSASDSSRWYVPRKKIAYDQYLDSLLKAPAKSFSANEPVYRQYELLRHFLKIYRSLDAADEWKPVDTKSVNLKPGDTSAAIKEIKIRLLRLQDFQGDTFNESYDADLIIAVKQFQYRNGLDTSGRLNKETIMAMNVPLKIRIKQILVNMERARWLPVSLNADFLAVNIPEFTLHVYHADSLLWSCPVVVGQKVHQTSIFYGEIKYVVFSPYWNIPQSIVRAEVVPGLKKSPDYLLRHQMEITGYKEGLPIVRQKPGPENSLGLVKFLFPNSYNIYLHDTPKKSLFGETTRDFSHGCIRIMEPAKLAAFLLKNHNKWSGIKIKRAMNSGKEQYVSLEHKVPVFITYFTAFTDRRGLLNFRKDIYSLDDRLARMIISGEGFYETN
ncbi:L,D-transpeptidase family protein [Mucilaginibacter paludis]|uniref:ErfK/YbiS/YcfS/YnhG family protein n=1 Tax=Mucilaginibacter paludis DSM 18603 TaxID=714943 RepID=H1Y657_9SPHI|nr:L,D-transpeptidase family protein [Mucilaginibacter paludis]EHQ31016.1 ErfK/YbiS/YcfS/YnhG family protein [Mucilaginibacter paludis DSM 18603]